ETRPGTEITVLSRRPRETRARYGYRAVDRFAPASVFRALRRCDALVFGGGSLLQDHTSTRSLLYYLAILSLARALGRKIMIYANGIGPVTREKNRERVLKAVQSADVVTLRDERSLGELVAMGVTREDIKVTSDPVFTMELPDEAERRETLKALGIGADNSPSSGPGRPFAVISARKWDAGESFIPELARLCDMISLQLGRDILFLPMQPPGDAEACRAVAAKMETPSIVPERELTLREYFGIIEEADFALSMRLHTLIFAARAGTPPLGIDVDPKLQAYLEALEMPCLGAPQELDAARAFGLIREISEKRGEISQRLTRLASEHGERAREDARLLAALLDA
ncbi:MAG: polysaccharide pyruvyl transferase CsaB, partial [Oscillospiraceae bacterium]|nr:polysaccharide pyruvyl transferase CsaB [Oscillospiraceae bacterium]